jgi:hypothetical protein
MSRLQIVPLQPQAQPTNQFQLPSVTPPAQGQNSLLQLAQSLSTVEPKLQNIIARLSQADQQNSLAAGEAWVHEQQIQSQDAFKQAISDGRIRGGDNPWMFLGAKQTVAKLEADKLNRDLWDSYFKSDIQHQDNPALVQQYARKFWTDRLANRDVDQLEVLGPAADQSTNALVQHHIQNRSQERVEEAEVGGAMELQSKAEEMLTPDVMQSVHNPDVSDPGQIESGNIDLNKRPVVNNPDGTFGTVRSISANIDGKEVLIPTVSADGKVLTNEQAIEQYKQTGQHLGVFDSPESATAYAQHLHQSQANQYGRVAFQQWMQQFVADKGRFLTTPRLNQMIKSAALRAAINAKNSDVYREVLRGVKTPGGDLATTKETDAVVDHIHRQIVQQELTDMKLDGERNQVKAERAAKSILELSRVRMSLGDAANLFDWDAPVTLDEIERMNVDGVTKDELRQRLVAFREQNQRERQLNKADQQDTEQTQGDAAIAKAHDVILNADAHEVPQADRMELLRSVAGIDPKWWNELARLFEQQRGHALENQDETLNSLVYRLHQNNDVPTPELQLEAHKTLTGPNLTKWNTVALGAEKAQFKEFAETASREVYDRRFYAVVEPAATAANMSIDQYLGNVSPDATPVGVNPGAVRQTAEQEGERARQEFMSAYLQYETDPASAGVSPDDRRKYLEQLKNDHAAKGITAQKYQQILHPPQNQSPATPPADPIADAVKSIGAVMKSESTKPEDVQQRIKDTDPVLHLVPRNFESGVTEIFRMTPTLSNRTDVISQLTDIETADATQMFGVPAMHGTDAYAHGVDETGKPWSNFGLVPGDREMTPRSYAAGFAYRDKLRESFAPRLQEASGIIDRIGQHPKARTDADVMFLMHLKADLTTYQKLVQQLGYSVNYAKEHFGDNAWQKVPLFASPEDMTRRVKDVAHTFGIPFSLKSPEFLAFHDAQQRFITDREAVEKLKYYAQ